MIRSVLNLSPEDMKTIRNNMPSKTNDQTIKTVFHHPVKHYIEIIVDNARTHTTQVVNINDFRLHPDGYCPVETINYDDVNGEIKTIQCFDELGISKGLKKLLLN
jgi:hypothetical protein